VEKEMSSSVFEFVAEKRDQSGKVAARAARRNRKVPAIVYGGGIAPQSILLGHNDILKHLAHEAVYSHVLDINIDGKTEKAILKDVQRHPAKPLILHLDFMRVDETHRLKTHIPLHFLNESICAGVKEGGVVTHAMVDVEVLCLSTALPEYIEVDLKNLRLGESIHLSDLVFPKGVESVALAQGDEHNQTVAQVMKTRTNKADEEEDASAAAASEDPES